MLNTEHQHIDPRINLLSRQDNQYPRGKKIFKVSKFIIYLLTILIIAFLVFSYQVIFTNSSLTEIFSQKINIFKQLSLLTGDAGKLAGGTDDRINILILGMGGAGHEGPYLTDTIILASIKPSIQKVAMISIPRDLLVEVPGFGWRKINNVNSFGETSNNGQGAELVQGVLKKTLAMPIHYYVRIDFPGFEKIIDDLGGLKIFVERGFTDYQYPTSDFKYQVIAFEPGWQTMDGETVLKFVRSRHGNNGEGSDFSRSQRQQKVLEALKNRVLSYQFFLSPRKISKVFQELSLHIKTNLEPWEIIKLVNLLEKADKQNIINKVLSDAPDGLLYASIINDAYVLQPRGDDFGEIQYFIQNIFRGEQTLSSAEIVRVEIRNGTEINGLASRHATELKMFGYRVIKTGNAPEQNQEHTKIYKLTADDKNDAEAFLSKKYKTIIIHQEIPDWIKAEIAPDIDFFIVLGKDAEEVN